MIWWPKKTNEMNHFKAKTWRGFNLTILKVKQIHYKRIEVFTIRFNPKSIATSSSNLLTRPWASSESTNSFSSWIYTNISHLACDFEIPLKGLATQTLQFVTPRHPWRFKSSAIVDLVVATSNLPVLMVWEWFSIVNLIEEGTIPFRSHRSTSKVFQKSEKCS